MYTCAGDCCLKLRFGLPLFARLWFWHCKITYRGESSLFMQIFSFLPVRLFDNLIDQDQQISCFGFVHKPSATDYSFKSLELLCCA